MDLLQAIVEGIVTNWVYGLLALLGGAVVAFLKQRGYRITEPILYGLATFALLIFIGVLFVAWNRFQEAVPQTTPQNVEESILKWTNLQGMSIKRVSEPKEPFQFQVTLGNGGTVTVVKMPDREMLTLAAQITFEFNKPVPPGLIAAIDNEMILELARFRTEWQRLTPMQFRVFERIPITSDLGQFKFVESLTRVASTMMALNAIWCQHSTCEPLKSR